MGSPQSKGCIRIPATLNVFIDHYGLLDADYERAAAEGKSIWVLRPDREPTPWSGADALVGIISGHPRLRTDAAPGLVASALASDGMDCKHGCSRLVVIRFPGQA
jgi:hypothetical protein